MIRHVTFGYLIPWWAPVIISVLVLHYCCILAYKDL